MPASADPRGGVLFYPGLSGGVFLGFCPAWASPESTPCMAEPQLLRKGRPDVGAEENRLA